jgi:tol-pal system protein YbgF
MQTRRVRRGPLAFGAIIGLCTLPVLVSAAATTSDANVAERISKLERALDNRGLVDLLQQVERLQQELQRLRGQIEEQSFTIEQMRNTQRDTYVDIDQRLQAMEGGGVVGDAGGAAATNVPPLTTLNPGRAAPIAGTAPQSSLQIQTPSDDVGTQAPASQSSRPATVLTRPSIAPQDEVPEDEMFDTTRPATVLSRPSPAPRVVTPDDDAFGTSGAPPSGRQSIAPRGAPIDDEASDNAYRDAFSLLKAGQYDESIAAFSGFLNRFPNSQYADNAQYWLAETYYVKRDYESALIEYQKLIELYPASKKQSHAMLKIGYSYYELGQYDQARAVLEDLRNRYAGSTAARLAEERITILANSPQ